MAKQNGKNVSTPVETVTEQSSNTGMEPTRSHLPADISLADQIKRDLAAQQEQVGSGGVDRIRMNARGFTPPDGETSATIVGVIVDFASANMHYAEAFDKDNPSPPNCFAINRIPDNLAPSIDAPEPQAQECRTCPKNEFKSGVGNAKACKNTRVLAIMAQGADSDDAPIWVLSVPPGSIRYFDTYISTTLRGRHQLPSIGVVTEIYMDHTKDFAAPRFKHVRNLSEEELAYYYSRRSEAEAILLQKPVMAA